MRGAEATGDSTNPGAPPSVFSRSLAPPECSAAAEPEVRVPHLNHDTKILHSSLATGLAGASFIFGLIGEGAPGGAGHKRRGQVRSPATSHWLPGAGAAPRCRDGPSFTVQLCFALRNGRKMTCIHVRSRDDFGNRKLDHFSGVGVSREKCRRRGVRKTHMRYRNSFFVVVFFVA